jgi:hypothetical protein
MTIKKNLLSTTTFQEMSVFGDIIAEIKRTNKPTKLWHLESRYATKFDTILRKRR